MFSLVRRLPSSLSNSLLEVVRLWSLVTKWNAPCPRVNLWIYLDDHCWKHLVHNSPTFITKVLSFLDISRQNSYVLFLQVKDKSTDRMKTWLRRWVMCGKATEPSASPALCSFLLLWRHLLYMHLRLCLHRKTRWTLRRSVRLSWNTVSCTFLVHFISVCLYMC